MPDICLFFVLLFTIFIIVVTQKLVLQRSKNVTAKCTENLSPPPCILYSLVGIINNLQCNISPHTQWHNKHYVHFLFSEFFIFTYSHPHSILLSIHIMMYAGILRELSLRNNHRFSYPYIFAIQYFVDLRYFKLWIYSPNFANFL